MFSTLDDNPGGGDSQSISETAHKLLPLSPSKHKLTPGSAKSPRQPAVIMRGGGTIQGQKEGGRVGQTGLQRSQEPKGLQRLC